MAGSRCCSPLARCPLLRGLLASLATFFAGFSRDRQWRWNPGLCARQALLQGIVLPVHRGPGFQNYRRQIRQRPARRSTLTGYHSKQRTRISAADSLPIARHDADLWLSDADRAPLPQTLGPSPAGQVVCGRDSENESHFLVHAVQLGQSPGLIPGAPPERYKLCWQHWFKWGNRNGSLDL